MILLFNSMLRLFPSKLRSRWLRPFQVSKVFPHGEVKVWSEFAGLFKGNGLWLKHYFVGNPLIRPLPILLLTLFTN